MSPKTLLATLSALTLWLGAFGAQAHIHITSHPTRDGKLQKDGPCGRPGGERSDNVLAFRPGETILLAWDETIFHPGYFRVSFDIDGDDDFVDPLDYFDFFTNETVMLDNLFPDHIREDRSFQQEVILPNIECDNCTLQLVQVMTDKPPYEPATNDLYYNCLDLVLTADEEAFETEFIGGGGGCGVSTPAKDASLFALFGLALLGFFVWRSSRR